MTRSIRRSAAVSLSMSVAILLGACTDTQQAGSPGESRPPSTAGTKISDGLMRRFRTYDSCKTLLNDVKALALERVGPYGFDGSPYNRPMPTVAVSETTAAPAAATTAKAAAGASDRTNSAPGVPPGKPSGNSSGTNTQEAGVDEGDMAENDGRYLYVVHQAPNFVSARLQIIDTFNGAIVSSVSLESGSRQMILDGTKLVIVAGGWGDYANRVFGAPIASSYVGANEATTITVYDVADRANPKRLSHAAIEGAALSVRASGGVVRVVAQSPFGAQLPLVQPVRTDEAAMKKATEMNKRVISESTIDDWLPRVASGRADSDGKVATSLDCATVGRPDTYAGLGLTWIATINTNEATPVVSGSGGVIAQGGQVYASEKNLFVATTRIQDAGPDPDVAPIRPEAPKTSVHQFALEGAKARYLASGEVPGVLLNSYAMSEFGDVLRVATTEVGAEFGSAGQQSGVRVLRRSGSQLNVVGSVSGLGRNEQIYAVRFVGAQGYVVTFRRTDPLYVLDLSDPTDPTVAGELKIPGYSSYLHPVGDGRLVGIGQDADLDGRVTGMQLSLFDVSDPTAPKRLANTTLGVYGQSEAEYDPHAFLYWDETRQLVVPSSGYNPQSGQQVGGATVATVGSNDLTVQGRVDADAPDGAGDGGAACPANASCVGSGSGQVRRSMVLNGKLVLIGDFGVSINSLDSLSRELWVSFS
jgi:hypothetical protein